MARKYLLIPDVDTISIEMTLKSLSNAIIRAIQLQDGRLWTSSRDSSIQLWGIRIGLCKRTLTDLTNKILMHLCDGIMFWLSG